jgi:4-amino-4-deoxy-L-arabinose transferase-like glycosyltransferase
VPLPEFLRRHAALALLALGLVLGLAFQGSRGLWEPDEGRYTNVALQMLHSGDWISLRRNQEALHFTKPPVTYWAIAASVATFGRTEWAVRLPIGLAFALTGWLVFLLGKRFVPEKPWLPALVYLASPVPFLAANTVNTDGMLALTETLAVLCYAQYRFGGGNPRWLDAMWAGFGLAFLTKGPPSLLPLLAILVFEGVSRYGGAMRADAADTLERGSPARVLLRPLGWLAFAVIGLGWYLVVIRRHPGLLDYFLGHEVYARIATDKLRRFPEWYGPFVVYLPTLVLGTLPWIAMALARLRGTRTGWREAPAPLRFLWLWFAVPLLVFCLARSRLPLYVLPLFVPLSLLLARALAQRRWTRAGMAWLAAWLLVLLGVKYWASNVYETDKDGRVFASQLIPLLPGHPAELLFVEDMTRNGLNLYFDTEIERLSFKPMPRMLSDSSYDQTLAEELAEHETRRVFIMKAGVERYFLDAVREAGVQPVRLGEITDVKGREERHRVVYTVAGDFPGGADATP